MTYATEEDGNYEDDERKKREAKVVEEKMFSRLDAIGVTLAQTRSEAIEGRQNSGIEDDWLEDEEYYEGVDDANRSELKAWRGKPLGSQLPLDDDNDQQGSTIFLNITRPYVDGTAARTADMLLPSTGDKGWGVKSTPQPDLLKLSKGDIPDSVKQSIREGAQQAQPQPGQPQPSQPQPGQPQAGQPQPGQPQPGQPQQAQMPQGQAGQLQQGQPQVDPQQEAEQNEIESAVALARETLKRAKESAKKVETQIEDWHVECQYNKHARRVIEDAAKVGSGVLKGPVPTKTTKLIYKDGKLTHVSEIKPASHRIWYRNFYPDPACGEDIHRGNYTWERDDITRRSLVALLDVPGYITPQIQKVIHEGPMEAVKDFRADMDIPGLKLSNTARKSLFEIWYYHGSMRKSDLSLTSLMSGKGMSDSDDNYGADEYVHVQITMVNNRLIKATLSHLENGKFPYDIMVWQRRLGIPFGIGVARQIRPAQRIVVGAMRHMMDNAGIAGGPMLFIDTNVVQASEGPNEVRPWKVYVAADDYVPGESSPREAIQFLTAPMLQAELQNIVELGMKMAEDVTGLPLIMQGQTSQRTPNTLGGMQLQNNNASTILRRVARLFDEYVTEPHIRRYYDHILQYSEDDSMKGEFKINALGSTALIERDLADQAMIQMGQYVLNPVFGKDPKKWLDEMLKVSKLDPTNLSYDDDEWQSIVENMAAQAEGPPDTRVEVAQMQIQGAQQLEEFKAQTAQQMEQLKAQIKASMNDRDREFKSINNQVNNDHKDKDRNANLSTVQMEGEVELAIAQLKEQGLDSRQLAVVKQKLQDTVMKLQTQVSLNGSEVIEPAVEPKGTAPDGKSFSK